MIASAAFLCSPRQFAQLNELSSALRQTDIGKSSAFVFLAKAAALRTCVGSCNVVADYINDNCFLFPLTRCSRVAVDWQQSALHIFT